MTMTDFVPSLFLFGWARVDSAAMNVGLPFTHDCRFFDAHPKRRVYLRTQWDAEFDKMIPAQYKAELPQLHVLVVRLSENVHHLTPVYRGSPFWSEPSTDADVASILAEMSRSHGFDLDEMKTFAAKHCNEVPSNVITLPKPSRMN